jgi:hypothetical protein
MKEDTSWPAMRQGRVGKERTRPGPSTNVLSLFSLLLITLAILTGLAAAAC